MGNHLVILVLKMFCLESKNILDSWVSIADHKSENITTIFSNGCCYVKDCVSDMTKIIVLLDWF